MDRAKLEASAVAFDRALETSPEFTYGWFVLGGLREQLGETEAAIAAFRRVRELDPADCFGAAVRLTRLGVEPPGDMPDAFMRSMFDQYAPRFEAELTGTLSYRGPALLRAAIEQACAAERRAMRFGATLDLGCGTGLAGVELRPFTDRLVGIDLSPGMIELARAKGIYDRLEAIGAMPFLTNRRTDDATFALIVAADVFVYLADLTPVLAAAAQALEPNGLLAFTVESGPGDSFELGAALRYAHGAGHVRQALAAAGLTPLDLAEVSTRTNAGVAVPGMLAVAKRG